MQRLKNCLNYFLQGAFVSIMILQFCRYIEIKNYEAAFLLVMTNLFLGITYFDWHFSKKIIVTQRKIIDIDNKIIANCENHINILKKIGRAHV